MADKGTDIGQAYVQIIPTAKGIKGNLESIFEGEASGAGTHIGGKVVAGIVGAIGAAKIGREVSSFLKDSVATGSEFDKAMAQVAATMGKSVTEIGNLRDFAKDMGATTAFSATQAAEALNYMALAGYDSEQAMAALPNVLNLAAAGSIDLAYASDMVTDAQSALGLSFEESAKLVDKMAMASSKSNTSVAQLGEAILTVGGTAKDLRGGTTELATMLGILADNGIKGAEGGTALRNMILSLSAPTDQAAALIEELGLNVYDAEGNLLPLQETFGQLQGILGTMSQKRRTEVLNTIFNKVDLKSANALLGTSAERFAELAAAIDSSWYTTESLRESFDATGISLEDVSDRLAPLGIGAEDISMALDTSGGNAELFAEMLLETANAGVSLDDVVGALGVSLEDLQGVFDSTSGAAEKMAGTQLDSLSGDVTILNSALEGLKIGVFDQMKEPLREVTGFVTEIVTGLTDDLKNSSAIPDFIAGLEEKIPSVKQAVSDFAQKLGEFASPVLMLGGWLVEHPEVITGLITGIGTAIVTNNLMTNLPTVVTNIKTLATSLANPANLGIFAVSAAIGGVIGILAAVEAKNAADQAKDLAAHFGTLRLNLRDLKAAANNIVNSKSLSNLNDALAAFDRSDGAIRAMDSAVQTLNKANWKVSIGMKLTEQEVGAYQSAIEEYVTSCQTWVDEQAYGVHLSLSVATAGIDTATEEGAMADAAAGKIEAFYQGKQKELADLGTELKNYVTEAFNDGLLDIDEAARIQELQQQMADIQRTLATSTFGASLEQIGMGYSGASLTPESFKNLQAEIARAVEEAKKSYGEAFKYDIAAVDVSLANGAIDENEAEALKDEIRKTYLADLGEIDLQAQSFSLNTIMEAYGAEIEAAAPELAAMFDDAMAKIIANPDDVGYMNELLTKIADSDYIDSTVRKNIKALLEGMAPTTEDLELLAEKYREMSESVPKNISEGLKQATLLEALTGDIDAIMVLAADELANSPELQPMLDAAIESGDQITESLAQAISDTKTAPNPEIDALYQSTGDYIRSVFASGFDVSLPVRIHTNSNIPSGMGADPRYYAAGGIVSRPELAIIGEGGFPESVIPWDGSRRALDLWLRTGEEIGAFADAAALSRVSSIAGAGNGVPLQLYSGLQRAVELLNQSATALSGRMENMQIILDSGELVGALSGGLDSNFARRTVYQSRRN